MEYARRALSIEEAQSLASPPASSNVVLHVVSAHAEGGEDVLVHQVFGLV